MQVRNDEDRNKQITDAVMTILSYEVEPTATNPNYFMTQSKFHISDLQWWSMASLVESASFDGKFKIEMMKPYSMKPNRIEFKQHGPDSNELAMQQSKQNLISENDDSLSRDWLCLFESGAKSDLIIYARDEKALKAHSLVILARCKRLLDNVIVENETQHVLSLPEVSKNVVSAFLKYL